jgi:mitotic spindle assembly checkpoint protein MAD2
VSLVASNGQRADCLHKKTAQKVVVVITDINTEETIERWQFDVECDEQATTSTKEASKIDSEIKAVIRQITASVSFLPLIDSR